MAAERARSLHEPLTMFGLATENHELSRLIGAGGCPGLRKCLHSKPNWMSRRRSGQEGGPFG